MPQNNNKIDRDASRLQPEHLHHDEDFAIGLHMYVSSDDQRS